MINEAYRNIALQELSLMSSIRAARDEYGAEAVLAAMRVVAGDVREERFGGETATRIMEAGISPNDRMLAAIMCFRLKAAYLLWGEEFEKVDSKQE